MTTTRTYPTLGDALADPTSNISRKLVIAADVRRDNEKVIAQWMATGLTREEAWAAALAAGRK